MGDKINSSHKETLQLLLTLLAEAMPESFPGIQSTLSNYLDAPAPRAALFKHFALISKHPLLPKQPLLPRLIPAHELLGVQSHEWPLIQKHADANVNHPAQHRWPDWSSIQFVRLALLLTAEQHRTPALFSADVELLFRSADVDELIFLYQSLPFFTNRSAWVVRAREGARSNMISVFEAIAHHNPFPAAHFDQTGWNQLVLKAVFNNCRLAPVIGLQTRRNHVLTRMLCDYIEERWAAQRTIPWDIWQAMDSQHSEHALRLHAQAEAKAKAQTKTQALTRASTLLP